MSNLFDYITWRGDLSFKTSPFNQIDSIVLCQILYANFETLIPEDFSHKIKLSTLAKMYFAKNLNAFNLGIFIDEGTADTLKQAGESERFKDIQLCGYVNHIEDATKTQFGAVTAILPTGELCVLYKGTDDSILGWEESLSLAYKRPIQGQIYATKYLDAVLKKFHKNMYVAGHSKGGNLAVYAVANGTKKNIQKVITIFDNDGPGFLKEDLENPTYQEILPKIQSIIPESSIVGPLLQRINKPVYIKSTGSTGIAQHDLRTWQVEGIDFVEADGQSLTGEVAAKTIETWLESLTIEKREEFLTHFFDELKNTGSKTLTELQDNWVKHSVTIVKSLAELNKETRSEIYDIFKIFFQALHLNFPTLKDLLKNG